MWQRLSEAAKGAKASQRRAHKVVEMRLHVLVAHWHSPEAVVDSNSLFSP
jgi:hypothetical protein